MCRIEQPPVPVNGGLLALPPPPDMLPALQMFRNQVCAVDFAQHAESPPNGLGGQLGDLTQMHGDFRAGVACPPELKRLPIPVMISNLIPGRPISRPWF